MNQTIRAASLTNFPEVSRFVGIDPNALLRKHNISRHALSDGDSRILARPAVALLEQTAEMSGHSDVGILLASCRSFASLGPVSLLLKHLATPRQLVDDDCVRL